MKSFDDLFDEICGKFERELRPVGYERFKKFGIEYARQACEEQRIICAGVASTENIDYPGGYETTIDKSTILNAPLPELK